MSAFLVMDCGKDRAIFGGFETLELAQQSIRATFKGLDAVPFFVESIIGIEWLACFSIKGKIVGQLAIRVCEIHSVVTEMKGARG